MSSRRSARSPRAVIVSWPSRVVSIVTVSFACLASACDPCAGVASCSEDPRLGVSGQIVDRGEPTDADRDPLSGAGIPQAKPVGGVRVEVIPTAGVTINAGEAVSTTDEAGWWQVSMPAVQEGGVTVDVVVTPPNGAGYRVRGLNLLTSRTRGKGNVLGRWTRNPFLTLVGEVYDAASGARVDGARVTAVRREGIGIEPTANTRTPMVTFGGGRFLYDMRPLADGPLVLDFAVDRDGLPTAVVRGLTVYPKHEWLPPNVDGDLVFVLDSSGHRVGG